MFPAFVVSFRLFYDENKAELGRAPFALATSIAFQPRAHGHIGEQGLLPQHLRVRRTPLPSWSPFEVGNQIVTHLSSPGKVVSCNFILRSSISLSIHTEAQAKARRVVSGRPLPTALASNASES